MKKGIKSFYKFFFNPQKQIWDLSDLPDYLRFNILDPYVQSEYDHCRVLVVGNNASTFSHVCARRFKYTHKNNEEIKWTFPYRKPPAGLCDCRAQCNHFDQTALVVVGESPVILHLEYVDMSTEQEYVEQLKDMLVGGGLPPHLILLSLNFQKEFVDVFKNKVLGIIQETTNNAKIPVFVAAYAAQWKRQLLIKETDKIITIPGVVDNGKKVKFFAWKGTNLKQVKSIVDCVIKIICIRRAALEENWQFE